LTRGQKALLALLGLALLLRGGLMGLSWAIQLSSGFEWHSYFIVAVFFKDAIYGLTALFGGLLLLLRSPAGWWLSLAHWCWYLACEIVVVGAAEFFDWRLPVHHEPPTLYRVMASTLLLGVAGLAILSWRPIARACRAPADRRLATVAASFIAAIALAFVVNGWMSLR
jgi:hypothetical protein